MAAMVRCGFHRRCRSRACPECQSMANLKKFDSVATQIRTFEDELDFISFVVTDRDIPVQFLREKLDEMAAKLTKQIERRKV
jgi:succinate dehydrogenase/fumarate reductase-like Fe-S protein